MPACHCSSCLKKKRKEKEKRMHPLSGFSSHLIWLSENVTVLILVSAALFECCLRLSDWTNKLSLPYVNKCRLFFFSFLFVIGNLNVQLFLFLFLSFSLTVLGAGPSLLQRWYLLISLHVWEMKSSGRLASTLWAIIKLRFVAQSILGVSVLWPNFLIASALALFWYVWQFILSTLRSLNCKYTADPMEVLLSLLLKVGERNPKVRFMIVIEAPFLT